MSSIPKRIGLALSGGGYRATAFHLGTLKKLNDLGILEHVTVISTISGGSITGAYYCTHPGPFNLFYHDLYEALQKKNVIRNLIFSWTGLRLILFGLILLGSFYFLFTSRAWIFAVIWIVSFFFLLKFQFQILPFSKRIEKIYDCFFYEGKKLGELPVTPQLVIGATNLQTAKPFVFARERMGDSTYQFMDDPIEFDPTHFPVARAVMASSCVPFAFTPVVIAKEFFKDQNEADKIHPVLVDGGVYDNQGIHKVMQKGDYACDYVVTSDAGCGDSGEMKFRNTFSLLMETVNVFMSRIKKAQMVRNVYDNASTVNKQVAYFSLGWDMENCIAGFIRNLGKKQITASVIEAHKLLPEWVALPKKYEKEITEHLKVKVGFKEIAKPTPEEKRFARKVGTNLTALNKIKVDCLIKQAEALTEIQVKLYCPSLL
jgi:NTE family protein